MNNLQFTLDSREKNKALIRLLKRSSLRMNVDKLAAGDIMFPSFLIERKSANDLLNSLADKRFFNQLGKLCAVAEMNKLSPLLLIEGSIKDQLAIRKWKPASVMGALVSVVKDFKVPVVMTEGEKYTLMFLQAMAKSYTKKDRLFSLREPPEKKLTPEEKACYVLEGISKIGPVTAREILGKVGSIVDVCQNLSNLESLGITEKVADEVRAVFMYKKH